MRYSEETLIEKLKFQGVVKIERIRKKIDGLLPPTTSFIVSFHAQVLRCKYYSTTVNLNLTVQYKYYSSCGLPVRPYIPLSRTCYYCQFFGHVGRK